jgi:nicotinamide mononucleotide transporter
MAIWGWYNWHKTRFDDEFIIRWTISHHLINILSSAGFTWILGYLFDTYTDQAMPYLDAFITVFSLGATFMVAKKVLENWIYWIIIDVVSVQLYLNKDLNLTALLYVFYTIMSVIGLVSWYYYYRKQIKV